MLSKKLVSINYDSKYPPDFMTHRNYVACFNEISEGLIIECGINNRKTCKYNSQINKKLTLIELTFRNLTEEYKLVLANPDYAEICVPWISVKAYYLLFNLQLIIKYLLSGDSTSFAFSHERMLKDFKEYIKDGTLFSNKELVNKICKGKDIQKKKFVSGCNVRTTNIDLETRYYQILKKILAYKIEDFQRKNKIASFRNKKNREEKDRFIEASEINICDFFYFYRIKANYRDLEFLDKNISSAQFNDFYKNYYDLTISFYNALKNLTNKLSLKRLGKEII